MGSGGVGTGVGRVGTGPGIGSVGNGSGGCSGGSGTSRGTLGVCDSILVLVLVLVLEGAASIETKLRLSKVIMGNSRRWWGTALSFEHEAEPEHEDKDEAVAR